ncbi:uncharacterized protein SCHCODRAFT_02642064 [Schizophyllum commune H4-8]|uniref:uncharacterized protein n=1 Tax=Schizophyllum commune (strain H4-8 / FGSC 9210) TaxID=578458 RepID=UPI00215F045A|nr:uncharacterized protein SCHCODRAFT_02642064 [Schizophyllum commune H4-8]KAI5886577.1 hypothetical protein SCHCODRAFT_02642064 [Schizophyllum commune H4-8]
MFARAFYVCLGLASAAAHWKGSATADKRRKLAGILMFSGGFGIPARIIRLA